LESNSNITWNEKEVCLIWNELNLYIGRHFQLYLVISLCYVFMLGGKFKLEYQR